MSDNTKRLRLYSRLTFWLSTIFSFLPIIIVGIVGCLNGTISMENKLKFGISLIVALFFAFLGIKSKYKCRSLVYIMLFGAFYVIRNVQWVVFLCGACCMIDEFMLQPLHRYYREKTSINKEIDKRLEV